MLLQSGYRKMLVIQPLWCISANKINHMGKEVPENSTKLLFFDGKKIY
jgi:hypothetical protein